MLGTRHSNGLNDTTRKAAAARVSKAIKNYLRRNKMTVREFNENVLHIKSTHTAPYTWIAGRGLPSAQYVQILSAAMKVPASFFAPRAGDVSERPVGVAGGAAMLEPEPADLVLEEAESDLEEILSATEPPNRQTAIVQAKSPRKIDQERTYRASCDNVLSFTGNNDGTSTVTLRYTDSSAAVQKVFLALAGMDINLARKDET